MEEKGHQIPVFGEEREGPFGEPPEMDPGREHHEGPASELQPTSFIFTRLTGPYLGAFSYPGSDFEDKTIIYLAQILDRQLATGGINSVQLNSNFLATLQLEESAASDKIPLFDYLYGKILEALGRIYYGGNFPRNPKQVGELFRFSVEQDSVVSVENKGLILYACVASHCNLDVIGMNLHYQNAHMFGSTLYRAINWPLPEGTRRLYHLCELVEVESLLTLTERLPSETSCYDLGHGFYTTESLEYIIFLARQRMNRGMSDCAVLVFDCPITLFSRYKGKLLDSFEEWFTFIRKCLKGRHRAYHLDWIEGYLVANSVRVKACSQEPKILKFGSNSPMQLVIKDDAMLYDFMRESATAVLYLKPH